MIDPTDSGVVGKGTIWISDQPEPKPDTYDYDYMVAEAANILTDLGYVFNQDTGRWVSP